MTDNAHGIRNLWAGETVQARRLGLLLVTGLALAIRLVALPQAYPAPGDAAHFVQHGVELARGNWEGLSTYWSQGMIVMAALARRLGLSPDHALQWLALLSGVLVTWATTSLGRNFFGSWRHGLLAGFFTATNPTLIYYSITGYSEMPYMAGLTLGALCLSPWLTGTGGSGFKVSLGFLFLGLGAYFKGSDALVTAAVVLAVSGSVALIQRQFSRLGVLVGALLTLLMVLLPLCAFTYSRTHQFLPGAKSLAIAVGDYWADSKASYALEKPWQEKQDYIREHGTLAFMWKYKQELAGRFVRNSAQSFRLLSGQMFVGPFRLGPAWTMLLLVGGVWVAIRQSRWRKWIWPVVLAGAAPAFICLALVHGRLLVPSLPFLFLLLSDVVLLAWDGLRTVKGGRLLLGVLLFSFLVKNASFGIYWADQDWSAPHMERVGKDLRRFGDDRDVLMCFGPVTAIHFYTNSPLRHVDVPYAPMDRFEDFCRKQGVTLVVLSDQARPHWPVSRLFHGEAPPSGWTLLEEMNFEENDEKGYPAEKFLLFRRAEPAPDSPDSGS